MYLLLQDVFSEIFHHILPKRNRNLTSHIAWGEKESSDIRPLVYVESIEDIVFAETHLPTNIPEIDNGERLIDTFGIQAKIVLKIQGDNAAIIEQGIVSLLSVIRDLTNIESSSITCEFGYTKFILQNFMLHKIGKNEGFYLLTAVFSGDIHIYQVSQEEVKRIKYVYVRHKTMLSEGKSE